MILVGEMRDVETIEIALMAAETGHLVMSTLHTNSAAESITRLLEIGMDPFTFSDSLLAVAAQRLVRRLCTDCRIRERLQGIELDYVADLHIKSGGGIGVDKGALIAHWTTMHGDAEGHLWRYRRHGCARCDGTGYHGRLGLHELLVADEPLRELIRRRAPALAIVALAQSAGMITLRQDGIEKMFAGLTDLPEVLAATNQ